VERRKEKAMGKPTEVKQADQRRREDSRERRTGWESPRQGQRPGTVLRAHEEKWKQSRNDPLRSPKNGLLLFSSLAKKKKTWTTGSRECYSHQQTNPIPRIARSQGRNQFLRPRDATTPTLKGQTGGLLFLAFYLYELGSRPPSS